MLRGTTTSGIMRRLTRQSRRTRKPEADEASLHPTTPAPPGPCRHRGLHSGSRYERVGGSLSHGHLELSGPGVPTDPHHPSSSIVTCIGGSNPLRRVITWHLVSLALLVLGAP